MDRTGRIARGGLRREKEPTGAVVRRPAPRTFRAVTVPSTVPPEERRAYLRDHYWDNFDFRDTTLLAEVDTVAMVRALFAYVANFVAPDDRRRSTRSCGAPRLRSR